jgi:hypothetical protein
MGAGRGASQASDPACGFSESITMKIEINILMLIPKIKIIL